MAVSPRETRRSRSANSRGSFDVNQTQKPAHIEPAQTSVRLSVVRWLRWSALTTIPLLLLTASGLLGTGGVGPYLREVDHWKSGGDNWLLYLPIIAVYSVVVEYILREHIQARVRRNFGPSSATVVASLSYALIHLRYGPSQFIYALALGYITATWFEQVNAWRPLAIWHLCWNAMAIIVALSL